MAPGSTTTSVVLNLQFTVEAYCGRSSMTQHSSSLRHENFHIFGLFIDFAVKRLDLSLVLVIKHNHSFGFLLNIPSFGIKKKDFVIKAKYSFGILPFIFHVD